VVGAYLIECMLAKLQHQSALMLHVKLSIRHVIDTCRPIPGQIGQICHLYPLSVYTSCVGAEPNSINCTTIMLGQLQDLHEGRSIQTLTPMLDEYTFLNFGSTEAHLRGGRR
jgi:hypothetical protein